MRRADLTRERRVGLPEGVDLIQAGAGERGLLVHTHHIEAHRLVQTAAAAVFDQHQFSAVDARANQKAPRGQALPVRRRFYRAVVGAAQIPGHAMKAFFSRRIDAAHHLAAGVANYQFERRRGLAALGLDGLPAGKAHAVAVIKSLFLGVLALLLQSREALAEVVGQHRAEGRVLGHIELVALAAARRGAEYPALEIPVRVAGLEQCGLLRRGVLGQFAQRRVIVEDEEAAPEARRDQVVLAALNLDIADGNRRHAGAELLPSRAAVEGHVHAELGRREHQAGALVVLHHAPHQMPFGDALGDAGPGAAAVARHQQIRRKVPVFVVIQGHVHGVRVVQIGADVVDESGVGNARQRAHLDAAPALAAVLGDLDQAVVGAGV